MAARVIKTGILYRTFSFDRAAIDKENRTVLISLSSEAPVERYFGTEILSHEKGAIRMERLMDGPLLFNHDPSAHLGSIRGAEVKDGKIYAKAVFGRSALAEEKWQDVLDGHLKDTSIGYRIHKMEEDKKGNVRAIDWEPHEGSMVTVPADTSVGIGRNVDKTEFETVINKFMDNQPTTTPTGATVAAPSSLQMPTSMLKESFKEFRAMAEAHGDKVAGLRELCIKAELEDWPVSRFRIEAGKLVRMPEPPAKPPIVLTPDDIKYYSISRAITQMAEGKLGGLEAELSQEITKRYGNAPSPMGFWVPPQILMGRTVQTTTAAVGGYAIETANLADQFIELLRNEAQVMRLGARTLNLSEPVTIPRQGAAGVPAWVAETAATTPTTLGLQQITLSPKCVTGHFQYGKQLLITSNPSIDSIVRDDLVQTLALAIDQVALHGGGSGEPSGIVSTASIGSINTATDGVAAGSFGVTWYTAAISLETLVSAANADRGSLAYLARSAHRGAMKAAQRFASTDSPVWTAGMYGPGQNPSNGSMDGVLNGYRAAVSNQIKTNLTVGTATTIASCMFFGNWNELLIGYFNGGALDLVVDPYTLAGNRIIRIIGSYFLDVGVRHAASFAILNGIL